MHSATDAVTQINPPQTLRVRFTVEPPSPATTKIEKFEGSFKFLTSSGSADFTIENAARAVLRPLIRPEFKAAGLNIRRSHSSVRPQSLTLWTEKTHFLGQVRGMPGDVVGFTEINKDRFVQRLYSNHATGEFPDDFQIVFKLYSNVEEKSVNFRFENVPLPTPDSKPVPVQLPTERPVEGVPATGVPANTDPAGPLGGKLPATPPGVQRDKNGNVIID